MEKSGFGWMGAEIQDRTRDRPAQAKGRARGCLVKEVHEGWRLILEPRAMWWRGKRKRKKKANTEKEEKKRKEPKRGRRESRQGRRGEYRSRRDQGNAVAVNRISRDKPGKKRVSRMPRVVNKKGFLVCGLLLFACFDSVVTDFGDLGRGPGQTALVCLPNGLVGASRCLCLCLFVLTLLRAKAWYIASGLP